MFLCWDASRQGVGRYSVYKSYIQFIYRIPINISGDTRLLTVFWRINRDDTAWTSRSIYPTCRTSPRRLEVPFVSESATERPYGHPLGPRLYGRRFSRPPACAYRFSRSGRVPRETSIRLMDGQCLDDRILSFVDGWQRSGGDWCGSFIRTRKITAYGFTDLPHTDSCAGRCLLKLEKGMR